MGVRNHSQAGVLLSVQSITPFFFWQWGPRIVIAILHVEIGNRTLLSCRLPCTPEQILLCRRDTTAGPRMLQYISSDGLQRLHGTMSLPACFRVCLNSLLDVLSLVCNAHETFKQFIRQPLELPFSHAMTVPV